MNTRYNFPIFLEQCRVYCQYILLGVLNTAYVFGHVLICAEFFAYSAFAKFSRVLRSAQSGGAEVLKKLKGHLIRCATHLKRS